MHKIKEEVILKILAQESLDLELWLKRYGILKFWAIFVDFSEAKELSRIIFSNSRGLGINFHKGLGLQVDIGKMRGLSEKNGWNIFSLGIIFSEENPWTESTSQWTTPGLVHRGPSVDGRPEVTEAWPPAAPVLKGASQGAEDGETGSGNLLRASPQDGRWRGGRAVDQNRRRWSVCR
jgi:hypothetical protein